MSGLVKYLERIHVSKPLDNECEWAPKVSEEDEPTKGQMVGVDEEKSVARDLTFYKTDVDEHFFVLFEFLLIAVPIAPYFPV
ncbi:MAG: hypothetical protein PHD87_04845 [Candidatus Cloacimonetes bacterium]|nr:hypothetical protein [Candidatus Cloacimonadota bacterium]